MSKGVKEKVPSNRNATWEEVHRFPSHLIPLHKTNSDRSGKGLHFVMHRGDNNKLAFLRGIASL